MTEAQWSKLRMEINVIMVLKCLPGRMQCSWLHVKQFTVCGLITKCFGSFYSREIQFHDNTPLRIMRTVSSLDHYTVGKFHCVQCGLFALCMSSIQSGTQLRISCSRTKAWISLHLCRSPPCQLQQVSWSLMLARFLRANWLLVLTGNILKAWGERLLKRENQSGLLTVGLERKQRDREIPYHPLPDIRHDLQTNITPFYTQADTTWHATIFVYTVMGKCVHSFRSRPWNLICR